MESDETIEIVKSNKGGLKIIYKSYMYTVHKKRQCGGIRWRCAQRSLHCKGSISTDADGTPKTNVPHNHQPDPLSVALARHRLDDAAACPQPAVNRLLDVKMSDDDSVPLLARLERGAAEPPASPASSMKSQPISPTKLKLTRREAPQEEMCLRWNSHHSNMQNAFPSILRKEQFVDVTLTAEGKTLKCHRLILSSCSAYFEEVLNGLGPFQHPVIFMKDIPFAILKSLCDFMYAGEVHISQNRLEELLTVAELLKIKGLTGKTNTPPPPPPVPVTELKPIKRQFVKQQLPQQQLPQQQHHLQQQQQQQQHKQHIDKTTTTSTSSTTTTTTPKLDRKYVEATGEDDSLDPLNLLTPIQYEVANQKRLEMNSSAIKSGGSGGGERLFRKRGRKRKHSDILPVVPQSSTKPSQFPPRRGRPRTTKIYQPDTITTPTHPHQLSDDPLLDIAEIKAEPIDVDDTFIDSPTFDFTPSTPTPTTPISFAPIDTISPLKAIISQPIITNIETIDEIEPNLGVVGVGVDEGTSGGGEEEVLSVIESGEMEGILESDVVEGEAQVEERIDKNEFSNFEIANITSENQSNNRKNDEILGIELERLEKELEICREQQIDASDHSNIDQLPKITETLTINIDESQKLSEIVSQSVSTLKIKDATELLIEPKVSVKSPEMSNVSQSDGDVSQIVTQKLINEPKVSEMTAESPEMSQVSQSDDDDDDVSQGVTQKSLKMIEESTQMINYEQVDDESLKMTNVSQSDGDASQVVTQKLINEPEVSEQSPEMTNVSQSDCDVSQVVTQKSQKLINEPEVSEQSPEMTNVSQSDRDVSQVVTQKSQKLINEPEVSEQLPEMTNVSQSDGDVSQIVTQKSQKLINEPEVSEQSPEMTNVSQSDGGVSQVVTQKSQKMINEPEMTRESQSVDDDVSQKMIDESEMSESLKMAADLPLEISEVSQIGHVSQETCDSSEIVDESQNVLSDDDDEMKNSIELSQMSQTSNLTVLPSTSDTIDFTLDDPI